MDPESNRIKRSLRPIIHDEGRGYSNITDLVNKEFEEAKNTQMQPRYLDAEQHEEIGLEILAEKWTPSTPKGVPSKPYYCRLRGSYRWHMERNTEQPFRH